ncbi:hypothetical protein DPMN_085718 [Dreissena polymorpha]|uniref:Uncharacterized protein n=1 Tax=Dreissena polymorpha TaxID=45954 RepID=A0A9D4BKI9_DREPO|nr:hypothetical protein DPMN_085718 [Dreissena polymorpha]
MYVDFDHYGDQDAREFLLALKRLLLRILAADLFPIVEKETYMQARRQLQNVYEQVDILAEINVRSVVEDAASVQADNIKRACDIDVIGSAITTKTNQPLSIIYEDNQPIVVTEEPMSINQGDRNKNQ